VIFAKRHIDCKWEPFPWECLNLVRKAALAAAPKAVDGTSFFEIFGLASQVIVDELKLLEEGFNVKGLHMVIPS